jgi:regulator of sigma E protease
MFGIILFVIVLVLLIVVHEWGHFYAAKKMGVRVDEFGIGFPPKIWGIKKGETEYTINALPLGGFVRIWGENPEDVENLSEEEKKRSFIAQKRWKQAIILFAGVFMNVVFAWFLYTIAFLIGVPSFTEAEDVRAGKAELTIMSIKEESPAENVLLVGDKIKSVSFDILNTEGNVNTPETETYPSFSLVHTESTPLAPQNLSDFIADIPSGIPLTLSIVRGGEEEDIIIIPRSGVVEDDEERNALGIGMALLFTERYTFSAPLEAFSRIIRDTQMIVFGLGSLIVGIFEGEKELLSQVAGPVGIAVLVGDAFHLGIAWLLLFTGIISLNLAVLNLLPIPALDGGRLVIVGIEAVRRKNLNPRIIGMINGVSFILLILLMVLVTIQDIGRFF